jgi:hypothetical protein
VKKAISICLSVYFLLGSLCLRMDYQQLFHLTGAVEHYFEHRAEAEISCEAFTITDFLMDHYLDPDHHQHEGDKQEQPCSHSHNHSFDFAKVEIPTTTLPQQENLLQRNPFSNITSFPSSGFTSGLDQPPSFC